MGLINNSSSSQFYERHKGKAKEECKKQRKMSKLAFICVFMRVCTLEVVEDLSREEEILGLKSNI